MDYRCLDCDHKWLSTIGYAAVCIECGSDEIEVVECMPFTNEFKGNLLTVLRGISESSLPIEVFDCFLHEYRNTGDLVASYNNALREWDC